jgi:hypothetical protein
VSFSSLITINKHNIPIRKLNMRFNDILIEATKAKPVNEAPVGMLKRAGLGIQKAFGSTKAAGKLDTGKTANQLRKDFDNYIGKTGQAAEPEVVISWLKSQGYPTTAAQAAMPRTPTAAASAAAPAAAPTTPAADPAAAPATDPAAAPTDGKIEPTLDNPPTAEPAAASAAAPAAAPTKTAPGNAAAPGAAQKQTNQNLNAYVQNAASTLNKATDPAQKMALTKELVNFMADRKDYPEWQNALGTVQKVIKGAQLNPNFANSAISRAKAGQTMESWQAYWINKLLEAVGYTWRDLGLRVLSESATTVRVVDFKRSVGTKEISNRSLQSRLAESIDLKVNIINEELDDKQIDAALLAAAQEAAKLGITPGAQAAAPAAEPAAATAPGAAPAAPAASGGSSDPAASTGGGEDPAASAGGGSGGPGAASKAGGFAQAALDAGVGTDGSSNIPPELLSMIKRLSPQQKQALLKLLKDPNKVKQVLV